MRELFSALKKVAIVLLALPIIIGCGTGGLADAPASSSTGGTTGGTPGQGSITFAVVKLSDPNTETTSISADSPAIVRATAKDSKGAVIAGKVMSFSSTFDIKFSPVSGTALTDSNGTAEITAMVGATAGAATITASISDSTGTLITNSTGITVSLKAPPAIPAGVTATATSPSQISLTWTASAGAAGYKIYRGGVLSTAVTTASFSDAGLPTSTQYCYAVSAYDGYGNESSRSSQVCATTYGPPPAIPAGLTVRATSPTQVDLTWTASAGASQYRIYRNGSALPATTATSYKDTVDPNAQYTYVITAIDATGSESAPTGQTVVHTGLTVPSAVTATVNSSTQITLSWTNSGGSLVTGYKVYKGAVLMGAVAPKATTSIVDGGLTANTQYCYNVSATSDAGGESAKSMMVCGTTQPPPAPASVDLLVSSPQLNSDGASTVTLTAVVKDTGNRALSGQAVSFTASSGLLTVTSGTTGANGTATATLGTGGDRTNRTITLNASTAGVNAPPNIVTVTLTTLSISGSSSISFGESTPLTIFLKDSAGFGIAGKTVTVTSDNLNTLSAVDPYVMKDASGNPLSGSYKTDANGQVIVTVTAAVGGADKIRAAAIGATKEFDLTVNASILKFINPAPPPAAVTEFTIGMLPPPDISAKYTINGIGQGGVTLNFVTTRGTLSSTTAVTDGSGVAKVTTSATNSGPVLFLASVANGPSAQVAAEFVAKTVNSVTLQAAPNTIGTNSGGLTAEKSLITAVVRDDKDNLVKGQTVNFNIVNDASGGSLSPASSITDSSGTASTYYIAGGATTSPGGVTVRGTLAGTTPVVKGETTLTVAKKALFITLATGPFIEEMQDKIRYKKSYVALVTDAAGDPVAGATVVATVTPVYYEKGYYVWSTTAARWVRVLTLQAASTTLPGVPACANEDGMLHNSLYDFNGVLNTDPLSGAKEDQNGNNRLDPGNVVSVTATPTDAAGHSTLSLIYAKNYAHWANVKLEAFASTGGSTASAFVTFDLPGLATEYTSQNVDPPGNPSPFGISSSCFVDLTATPISSTQMSITWQQSAGADHYHVYRDGAYVGNATRNTYSDTGLTAGTSYCYQIRTVDALGIEAVLTDTLCAATIAAIPATPTGLAVTALSSTQIRVSWNSMGLAGYRIYRDNAAAALNSIVSTSMTDTGLTADTTYCYTVSGYNSAGVESAKSAPVCGTTKSAPPTGLTATGSIAPAAPTITLRWTTTTGAASYRIYRDGTLVPLTIVGSQATDATVAALTWYCYQISSVDAAGNESERSAPICTATTP